MKARVSLAMAIAVCFAASRATAGCKELATAIDTAEKDMGVLAAKSYVDDNAPRELIRRQMMGNDLASIQANLGLMDRLKCPALADPVAPDGSSYVSAASNCEGALGDDKPKACDRSKWVRRR